MWPLLVGLPNVTDDGTQLTCDRRESECIHTSFLFLPSSSLDFFLEGLFGSSPPLAWSIFSGVLKVCVPTESLRKNFFGRGGGGEKNSSNSTKREFRLLLRKKTSTTIEVTSFQNPFRVKKSTRKYIQSWPLLNSSRIVSNRREGNLEKRCGRVSCRSSCLFHQPVKTSRSVCNENVQKRYEITLENLRVAVLLHCDCFALTRVLKRRFISRSRREPFVERA